MEKDLVRELIRLALKMLEAKGEPDSTVELYDFIKENEWELAKLAGE